MMNNDDIKICKFPPEKRKKYISWRYFEYLKRQDKDYWDAKDGIKE